MADPRKHAIRESTSDLYFIHGVWKLRVFNPKDLAFRIRAIALLKLECRIHHLEQAEELIVGNRVDDLDPVTSENWVDLKIGDKGVVRGTMAARCGADTLLVGQPDWSDIAIALRDEGGMQPRSIQRSQVTIIVERTEDGLQTSIDNIIYTG